MSQANSIITNGVHKHGLTRIVSLSVALTADTYATAAGGITIDVSTELNLLGLNWTDIVGAFGFYLNGTGTTGMSQLSFTKTATTGQFTIRSAASASAETADGALTGTINVFLMVDTGSRSYNT